MSAKCHTSAVRPGKRNTTLEITLEIAPPPMISNQARAPGSRGSAAGGRSDASRPALQGSGLRAPLLFKEDVLALLATDLDPTTSMTCAPRSRPPPPPRSHLTRLKARLGTAAPAGERPSKLSSSPRPTLGLANHLTALSSRTSKRVSRRRPERRCLSAAS